MIIGFIIVSIIKKSPEHLLNRNLENYKKELEYQLEELKKNISLEISDEVAKNEHKRMVYTNLIASMAVFIGGRISPEQHDVYVQNFYNNYDVAWLWASDEVLMKLSTYMQFKIDQANPESSKDKFSEVKEKELFLECVFSMRKDVFKNTTLEKEAYKFIKF